MKLLRLVFPLSLHAIIFLSQISGQSTCDCSHVPTQANILCQDQTGSTGKGDYSYKVISLKWSVTSLCWGLLTPPPPPPTHTHTHTLTHFHPLGLTFHMFQHKLIHCVKIRRDQQTREITHIKIMYLKRSVTSLCWGLLTLPTHTLRHPPPNLKQNRLLAF